MTSSRPTALLVWLVLAGPAAAEPPAPAAPDPDYRVTRVRFLPAPGRAADLKGGRFAGSLTGPTNDFETIADVPDAPADGWSELAVPPARVRAYRYVKFLARNDARAELAEVEFLAGPRKLTGTPFATTGAAKDGSDDPKRAFDGDPGTAFRGAGTFGQYVGLDLGDASQAARPVPSVPQGAYSVGPEVALSSATPGATVRYSLDGAGRPGPGAPTYDNKPVRVAKSSIRQAVATKPGLADSPALLAAYRVGPAKLDAGEVAEFHVGNSLTDTVNDWVEPLAASAGKRVRYYRFTIPGAPTDWLWDHPGSGFGESNYAQAFLARAPLTDLVTQPFAGHGRSVDNEAEHSGKFFDLARKYSPGVRLWLYVQWPDVKWDRDSWANGRTERGGKQLRFAEPAKTWGAAVANHAKYTELVRDEVTRVRAADTKSGACKPVGIVPGGPALARLKAEMEAGKVPGLTDFFDTVFAGPGDIHMSKKGAYLIALVHYGCLHGESPEGKVTAAGSGLTPEQAAVFQRFAWETVRVAPHARPGAAGK